MMALRKFGSPDSADVQRGNRRGSPIGLPFVGFVVVMMVLVGLVAAELTGGIKTADGLAANLGVVAGTVFALAAIVVAHRASRLRQPSLAAVVVILLAVGTLWPWSVFVRAQTSSMVDALVAAVAGAAAIVLLLKGLQLLRWMEVFCGLGLAAVVLASAVVRSDPTSAPSLAFLAMLVAVGGISCLYGTLVDLEVAEERAMVELLESKHHIENEMARAEEILHDLRSGLLAIEAAIGAFDGELAAPLRAEAARLRRLTIRGQRVMGPFDLADRVRSLVDTRSAGGAVVELKGPSTARVWGEESEVLSIVENLLSNAERHGQSTPILVEITEGLGTTTLEVTNGGQPLTVQEHDTIFERGTTTHPDGQGIGLSRARMLATLNSAELDVRPTDDGTTTFALDLRSTPPVAV